MIFLGIFPKVGRGSLHSIDRVREVCIVQYSIFLLSEFSKKMSRGKVQPRTKKTNMFPVIWAYENCTSIKTACN